MIYVYNIFIINNDKFFSTIIKIINYIYYFYIKKLNVK